MWHSIQHRPYQRPLVPNPDNLKDQILEPLSKMTEGDKKKYIADVRVINYILQAIPNDINNSVDECANAKEIWERIKRLMHGSDITATIRHSQLMDEFDKFATKEGESLDFVHKSNVTMVHQNQSDKVISYDILYDSLVQFEPHVLVSRAKKAAKNHDPLALIAHSNASSSHLHAKSSYSPQSYYVTHPPSVIDYDDEYQGELQGDSQEDKLTTAMILLARAISQKFSSPTNNHLCVSSNTKNQAVVQDGRVDIQTKNAGYGGIANKNLGRNRNQMFNAGNASDESNQIVQRVPQTDSTLSKANVQCYNCNEKCHYARDCQKPKVRDAKYFREKLLLAMKDEAGSHLSNEENNFMLDNAYGEESLDELTASVMLMARLQPAAETTNNVPSYDDKAVSQVHDSSKAHEQVSHVTRKTIIQTTDDDQIDSSIIFDDPHVDNNGGTSKHDSIAHEENHAIQMLAYNVQCEAEKQKHVNKYKETCEDLTRELRNDKDTIDRLLKEKDKIQRDFFKFENEKLLIQHETQLAKKAFRERENQYLEDIVDLEEKLSSHDRIVYKMGQSLQTIHMLRKKPNKIYDPFLKAGLGYQNPERLKKAIAAQPKMYDGDMLHSEKLIINLTDSEETLEDAEKVESK
ncbi:putative ribonuclease H-like domain-containing protein [Tanacetum coccineum]